MSKNSEQNKMIQMISDILLTEGEAMGLMQIAKSIVANPDAPVSRTTLSSVSDALETMQSQGIVIVSRNPHDHIVYSLPESSPKSSNRPRGSRNRALEEVRRTPGATVADVVQAIYGGRRPTHSQIGMVRAWMKQLLEDGRIRRSREGREYHHYPIRNSRSGTGADSEDPPVGIETVMSVVPIDGMTSTVLGIVTNISSVEFPTGITPNPDLTIRVLDVLKRMRELGLASCVSEGRGRTRADVWTIPSSTLESRVLAIVRSKPSTVGEVTATLYGASVTGSRDYWRIARILRPLYTSGALNRKRDTGVVSRAPFRYSIRPAEPSAVPTQNRAGSKSRVSTEKNVGQCTRERDDILGFAIDHHRSAAFDANDAASSFQHVRVVRLLEAMAA